jgi:hypothetical protein
LDDENGSTSKGKDNARIASYKADRVHPYNLVYKWNELCNFGGPLDYDTATDGLAKPITESQMVALVMLTRATFKATGLNKNSP